MFGLVVAFYTAMTEPLPGVNVMDFGAAADGITEDTHAFIRAFSVASATGTAAYIPERRKFAIKQVDVKSHVHMHLWGEIVNMSAVTFSIVDSENISINQRNTGGSPSKISNIGGEVVVSGSRNVHIHSVGTPRLIIENSRDVSLASLDAKRVSLVARCRSVTNRVHVVSSSISNVELTAEGKSTILGVSFDWVNIRENLSFYTDQEGGHIHNIYLYQTPVESLNRQVRGGIGGVNQSNPSNPSDSPVPCGEHVLVFEDEKTLYNVMETA